MGWTVDALWAAARFSLGSPISGPTGAGPVSGGGEELRKFAQFPNPQLPPLPATMTLPIRPRVGTCPGEWLK